MLLLTLDGLKVEGLDIAKEWCRTQHDVLLSHAEDVGSISRCEGGSRFWAQYRLWDSCQRFFMDVTHKN